MYVPDIEAAEIFYTRVWRLDVVDRAPDSIYLRGTGADHHLVSFHRGERTAIRDVTFRARTVDALDAIVGGARVETSCRRPRP